MMAAFEGGSVHETPIAPLYLGLYRAPHARRLYIESLSQLVPEGGEWSPSDDEQLDLLHEVDLRAFGIFQREHDWIDVSGGPAFPLISGGTARRRGQRLWWTDVHGQEHDVAPHDAASRDQWIAEQAPQSKHAPTAVVCSPAAPPGRHSGTATACSVLQG